MSSYLKPAVICSVWAAVQTVLTDLEVLVKLMGFFCPTKCLGSGCLFLSASKDFHTHSRTVCGDQNTFVKINSSNMQIHVHVMINSLDFGNTKLGERVKETGNELVL